MKSYLQLSAVFLLFVVSACHSTKKTTKSTAKSSVSEMQKKEAEMNLKLFQREWTLVQLSGFSENEIAQLERKPTLTITGTISGFGGCNRLLGGKYTLRGNNISISGIASTKMLCAGTGQKVETVFLPLLNDVKTYKMESVNLWLYTDDNRHAQFIALDKE